MFYCSAGFIFNFYLTTSKSEARRDRMSLARTVKRRFVSCSVKNPQYSTEARFTTLLFTPVILLCPLFGVKAPAGLTRLLLSYMWKFHLFSSPPYEPWTISRCTWALPQACCICKVCQLCCSHGSLIQICPIFQLPSHSPPPHTIQPQLPTCRHPLPLLPERLTPIWT